MSVHKLKSKPKELMLAKQLIEECKFDEADLLKEETERIKVQEKAKKK